MIKIILLHVSEGGCQPQGVFQINEIQVPHATIDMHLTYWNEGNIKILEHI
jgi:hypothetical protein